MLIGGFCRNLPVFALASAKPLARRRAVLAETPGSSRVPRVRFPQTANTKQKSHPKGVAFLFGGGSGPGFDFGLK